MNMNSKPQLIEKTRNGRWYSVAGYDVPSVTTVLQGFKCPHWLMEFMVKQAGGDPRLLYDKKGEALRVGSLVHESIDKILNGESITLDNDHEAQKALISFMCFWKKYNPKPFAQEQLLASEEMRDDSLRYGFAGTVDLVAEIDGDLWLCDYKTSQQLDPEMGLQLSAYKMLWDSTHDRKIDRLGIVWCKKTFRGQLPAKSTKYLHEFEYSPKDWFCAFKLFQRYCKDTNGVYGPKLKIDYINEFSLDVIKDLSI
tara:strand:- start:596 stop:1357 length:762 start_codon:yes stop_codon:yes gene_type:complete